MSRGSSGTRPALRLSPARAQHLRRACERLVALRPAADWWPAESAFEKMAGAVLVQNTRWEGAASAIEVLRDGGLLSPSAILSCGPKPLASRIRAAGCQTVKARRLFALAEWAGHRSLDELQRMPTLTLRRELLSVHGVGPETADAILCYALARPVFVADAYARRWLSRMGLLAAVYVSDYAACRELVEGALRWEVAGYQALHAAVVMHAQQTCRAAPSCADCSLESQCRKNINKSL